MYLNGVNAYIRSILLHVNVEGVSRVKEKGDRELGRLKLVRSSAKPCEFKHKCGHGNSNVHVRMFH